MSFLGQPYVGSGITRLLAHIKEIGPWKALKLLYYHADTKSGRLVGIDEYGNKYFENLNELPYRHRWVEYRLHDYDGAQLPAEWQSWMHHIQQDPPTNNVLQNEARQAWAPDKHVPNLTFTVSTLTRIYKWSYNAYQRGAYRPYNSAFPGY